MDLVRGRPRSVDAGSLRRRAAETVSREFDEGKLRGPVDRDEEVEFAFGGSNLGNIDMEVSDRISLELSLRRGFPFNLGQPRDSMAPQAA